MVGAGPDPVSTLDHGRCQGYPPRLPPSTTTTAYHTIPQASLTLPVPSMAADAIPKDDAGGSHAFHVPHSCPAYCLLLFARPTHAAGRALIPFLSASYPSSPSFLLLLSCLSSTHTKAGKGLLFLSITSPHQVQAVLGSRSTTSDTMPSSWMVLALVVVGLVIFTSRFFHSLSHHHWGQIEPPLAFLLAPSDSHYVSTTAGG